MFCSKGLGTCSLLYLRKAAVVHSCGLMLGKIDDCFQGWKFVAAPADLELKVIRKNLYEHLAEMFCWQVAGIKLTKSLPFTDMGTKLLKAATLGKCMEAANAVDAHKGDTPFVLIVQLSQ